MEECRDPAGAGAVAAHALVSHVAKARRDPVREVTNCPILRRRRPQPNKQKAGDGQTIARLSVGSEVDRQSSMSMDGVAAFGLNRSYLSIACLMRERSMVP